MTQTYGPYSSIRQAGQCWYTSGQIGVAPGETAAAADITSQTQQAMNNLQAVLATANLRPDDVVKTTIYLKNMSDFETVNKIYGDYFPESAAKPARSCVAVAELPRIGDTELLIEIEAIASKGSDPA
jgi:2-iminobutanoate/2-iminopropanoate deaminase